MMDERAGITWFLSNDNIEVAHMEFSWIVEGCIVDRDE